MSTSAIEEQEYRSSATLIILGTWLEPRAVSSLLRMRPSQSWTRGDAKTHKGKTIGDSPHDWGGWKKFLPPSRMGQTLPQQLLHWSRSLAGKADAFSNLRGLGYHVALNCFVGTSESATIALPADLQVALGSLGLTLELDVWAGA